MHLGALRPLLCHWRRANYVPAPSMLHNSICAVQNATWNAPYWVTHLCNCVLVSFNALWHACMLKGCAVACDSGGRPAAGPAKMAIWAIIFHQPPLEVAWGGTCTIPIKSFLDPVSRYIAGIHLHRGLLRLVCIKGTDQSILSPAPSKKIRYTEIDAFHRHHGPMARAACGGRGAVGRP